jgi:hypothetical protein
MVLWRENRSCRAPEARERQSSWAEEASLAQPSVFGYADGIKIHAKGRENARIRAAASLTA